MQRFPGSTTICTSDHDDDKKDTRSRPNHTLGELIGGDRAGTKEQIKNATKENKDHENKLRMGKDQKTEGGQVHEE